MNIKEIRDMSSEELLKEVDGLKAELYNLRFAQATGGVENTAHIKEVRKTIARIKTVITERENAKSE